MQLDYQTLAAIALGISLSASCGFRIFIPLLAVSVAGLNNWVNLPSDMQWLASWPAIICFVAASICEIGAYYIAFLDNILDTVATPVAFIAGTLLATSLIPLPEDQPLIRWGIGLLAGGAPAGIIQLGTGLVRLFTTKATIGTGNILVASGENAAALLSVILSFVVPLFLAALLLLLVIWIASRTIRRVIRHEEPVY